MEFTGERANLNEMRSGDQVGFRGILVISILGTSVIEEQLHLFSGQLFVFHESNFPSAT